MGGYLSLYKLLIYILVIFQNLSSKTAVTYEY